MLRPTLLSVTLCSVCSVCLGQEPVVISGTAYVVSDKNDYREAPAVVVHAQNTLGPIGKPVTSDEKGTFSLKVPSGEPISVFFRGETDMTQLIPEMRQLAGKAGTTNQINVALYTPEQYAKSFGAEKLREKLTCLAHQVHPKDEATRSIVEGLRADLRN